ncbi:hypothetical protein BgAZ_204030 [Babesia gibsoni]|uniref:Mediator of RNA polymerase II transcription subunit 7 n=1 Tax=Babesia gibsoni TaxID=33632 RepID=A0AAD8LKY7_BABGI|nr:hypothetical protein BgAZ_204030 [Babesia gibsoni]
MDEFTSGFPPPPFFYKNYSFKEGHDVESSVCGHSATNGAPKASYVDESIEDLRSRVVGPDNPPPPKESWFNFGVNEHMTEEQYKLDSDTAISLPEEYPEAKQQFKLLYRDFMDSLLAYLSALKDMNADSVSEIKRFIKLYINLQHLLYSLTERQAQDDVVRMLREQLERRRRYIDSMKVVLVEIHKLLSNAALSGK